MYLLLLFVAIVSRTDAKRCSAGNFIQERTGYGRRRRRTGIRTSIVCIPCPIGYYMNLDDHTETSCFPCLSPQWQDTTGSVTCNISPGSPNLCPSGKWGIIAATLPSTPCHYCPSGKFQTNPGQGDCHPCLAGTYQDLKGASSCKLDVGICGPGKYGMIGATTREEAKTCKPCPIDSFSEHSGMSKCNVCPRGEHQPLEGSTNCLKTPSCPQLYVWDNTVRECRIRHSHIELLLIFAWTSWILNFILCCCTNPNESIFNGMIPVYNLLVGLGIGIETSRRAVGYLGDVSFWTMVGFLAISYLFYICLAVDSTYRYYKGCMPRLPTTVISSIRQVAKV